MHLLFQQIHTSVHISRCNTPACKTFSNTLASINSLFYSLWQTTEQTLDVICNSLTDPSNLCYRLPVLNRYILFRFIFSTLNCGFLNWYCIKLTCEQFPWHGKMRQHQQLVWSRNEPNSLAIRTHIWQSCAAHTVACCHTDSTPWSYNGRMDSQMIYTWSPMKWQYIQFSLVCLKQPQLENRGL